MTIAVYVPNKWDYITIQQIFQILVSRSLCGTLKTSLDNLAIKMETALSAKNCNNEVTSTSSNGGGDNTEHGIIKFKFPAFLYMICKKNTENFTKLSQKQL